MDQSSIDALRAQEISPRGHFINGAYQAAENGAQQEVLSPIDGQPLTRIAEGTLSDVDTAVHAARLAFEDGRWSRMSPAGRKKVLLKLADLIESHALEIAVMGVRDNGTEINMAYKAETLSAAGTFRYYAEAIDKVYGQVAPTGHDVLGLIHHAPVGVVGAIVPWNFPLMIGSWKIAPALAAGNSIVLKPAESASLSLLKIAELAAAAGVPDGVFNASLNNTSVFVNFSGAIPASGASPGLIVVPNDPTLVGLDLFVACLVIPPAPLPFAISDAALVQIQ